MDEQSVAPDQRSSRLDVATPQGARRNAVARLFVSAVGLAVIVQFTTSSLAHLANPYSFLSSIYAYHIVGASFGLMLAIWIPFVQLGIASCLLFRVFVPAGFALATFLFGVFSAAQASALWRGLGISCGCWGAAGSQSVSYLSLSSALATGLGCFAAYWLTRESTRSPGWRTSA